MKRTLLLVAVMLLLAVPAMGGGINLTWGAGCWPDLHSDLQTFACNSNLGTNTLTPSFMTDVDRSDFVGIQVHLVGLSYPVFPWWQLDSGQCRPTPGFNANFTGAPYNAMSCFDVWHGGGSGGVIAYLDYLSPGAPTPDNEAFMSAAFALAEPVDLPPGKEIYACQFIIDHTKTVGTGACYGCTVGMYWTFDHIDISSPGSSETWSTVIPGGNKTVRWQEGPDASRPTTWGQVKSLYR